MCVKEKGRGDSLEDVNELEVVILGCLSKTFQSLHIY